jgi:quercetin dioxygenase-like cupin family protein
MQLTKRRVMDSAAVVLAAGVIAGAVSSARPRAETPEAPSPTGAAAEKDKPTVAYWHVWTDEKGVSHQKGCELSAFELKSISAGAAPSWIDKQSTPGATVLVVVQPVGWVGEWHENPKPQWIIPLSGRWFVETMDGKRVEMGPGDVSFGGDQNTKPDAQGRKGHRSGTVGNQPSVNMIVQLDKDPAAGQPCGFK